MSEIKKELARIQKELKAPKAQYNSFGKYSFRSCEDILTAVKPLLGDAVLTISDEIKLIGDRYYVEALASLSLGKEVVSTRAFARESLLKKGMDESQVTGAASSYARKYALNGLFCIDDIKDADFLTNETKIDGTPKEESTPITYYLKVGKYKGMMICEVPHEELLSYYNYWKEKDLKGALLEDIKQIEKYIDKHCE